MLKKKFRETATSKGLTDSDATRWRLQIIISTSYLFDGKNIISLKIVH